MQMRSPELKHSLSDHQLVFQSAVTAAVLALGVQGFFDHVEKAVVQRI